MHWRILDMKSEWSHPRPGQPVALYLEPKNPYLSKSYQAGTFEKDRRNQRARKLWWHSNWSVCDPIEMLKEYNIKWCPLPPVDADSSSG